MDVQPGRVWSEGLCRAVRGWVLRIDGGAYEAFTTKSVAMRCAREECLDLWGDVGIRTELRIKDAAGRIRDTRTYPRSSDPRRTRG